MLRRYLSTICLFLFVFSTPVNAQQTSLVSIKTSRGVVQKIILIKPKKPIAAAILFAGGHGGLGLRGKSSMKWGKRNFLVRTRTKFASKGIMVALIDAPSDSPKMSTKFRLSNKHAEDISAVTQYLKKQSNTPVWLVGTSMGTFSAAKGGIFSSNVDGVILTSTMTRTKSPRIPDGVASMSLQRIQVPVLVLSHKNDKCKFTPAADAPKLTNKLTNSSNVKAVMLTGGKRPKSEPCKALSQHGFFGIETKAVNEIVNFIKSN